MAKKVGKKASVGPKSIRLGGKYPSNVKDYAGNTFEVEFEGCTLDDAVDWMDQNFVSAIEALEKFQKEAADVEV